MPMKIAIILNTTWNAFNFRRGLIKAFLAGGSEVVVIAPADEYAKDILGWGARHIDISLDKSGMNPMADSKYKRQLKRILKLEKPNVVLSYTIKPNIYGSLVCGSMGIPIINNVSGLGTTFLWKGWIQKVVSLLYQRAFNKSSFVFFQNIDDQELFLKNVSLNKEKTGLLPGSGIDLTEYRSANPNFDSPLKILMVGRLIIDKGIREYLAVADRIKSETPNVDFFIAGGYDSTHKRSIDESEFNDLKQSSTVSYLGQVDNMQELIKSVDLLVLPSYREGTPRTLLEGAAMSRPIITTDVPGCREVVTDGSNGFLCEPYSVDNLYRKIKLFMALSKEEKMKMSVASRKLVEERFDESIVINEYEMKIKQIAK